MNVTTLRRALAALALAGGLALAGAAAATAAAEPPADPAAPVADDECPEGSNWEPNSNPPPLWICV